VRVLELNTHCCFCTVLNLFFLAIDTNNWYKKIFKGKSLMKIMLPDNYQTNLKETPEKNQIIIKLSELEDDALSFPPILLDKIELKGEKRN
jgi:hypothetical protein